jgi:hypothetical protein
MQDRIYLPFVALQYDPFASMQTVVEASRPWLGVAQYVIDHPPDLFVAATWAIILVQSGISAAAARMVPA